MVDRTSNRRHEEHIDAFEGIYAEVCGGDRTLAFCQCIHFVYEWPNPPPLSTASQIHGKCCVILQPRTKLDVLLHSTNIAIDHFAAHRLEWPWGAWGVETDHVLYHLLFAAAVAGFAGPAHHSLVQFEKVQLSALGRFHMDHSWDPRPTLFCQPLARGAGNVKLVECLMSDLGSNGRKQRYRLRHG